jgi:hypothetical protein
MSSLQRYYRALEEIRGVLSLRRLDDAHVQAVLLEQIHEVVTEALAEDDQASASLPLAEESRS